MRLLVCGDRNWTDVYLVAEHLERLQPEVVIEGEARGADTIARKVAELMEIEVLPFPAEWGLYSGAAGPIRNRQMLEEGKPDRVLAFHDDLENSSGTADMIYAAKAAGLPIEIISHDEEVWTI